MKVCLDICSTKLFLSVWRTYEAPNIHTRVRMSDCFNTYKTAYLSACLPVCLSACLPACLLACLATCLLTSLPAYLHACLSLLSVRPSVCLSVVSLLCRSVYMLRKGAYPSIESNIRHLKIDWRESFFDFLTRVSEKSTRALFDARSFIVEKGVLAKAALAGSGANTGRTGAIVMKLFVSVKPHLHEQWHFWFLSHLTNIARLSVWFCQALRPILRWEFSYFSIRFCAMWCPSVRCLQKSDRRPGKIGRTAKIVPILAVSCKWPFTEAMGK